MNGRFSSHRGMSALTAAMATLAVLFLQPAAAYALPTCTTPIVELCSVASKTSDCDGDGYSDYDECNGFTVAGSSGRHIAGYNETAVDKMDPSNPDLLYLVTDATLKYDITATSGAPSAIQPSLLNRAMATVPAGALSVYGNGLKIGTHRIYRADILTDSDRLIVSGNATTKAALIAENAAPANTATGDTALGLTKEGRTSAPGIYSSIYTYRIQNNVYTKCPTDTSCSVKGTLPLLTKRDDIVNYYILQVVAHEMGHGSNLASANTDGYYHYSKSGTVMDPATTFSRGVYIIPTNFDPLKDPAAVALK